MRRFRTGNIPFPEVGSPTTGVATVDSQEGRDKGLQIFASQAISIHSFRHDSDDSDAVMIIQKIIMAGDELPNLPEFWYFAKRGMNMGALVEDAVLRDESFVK
jgi:hypothetical protein